MPLAENTVSRSPSNFGLSGLRRTLVLVLGAALLLGVVHRKYWAYSTPQTNLPPHNDSPSRATIHSLMGDEVSDESAYVSETSGTDDNLNVCRRPAARSENRAAVTPAAGPIPFFGRNDEASRREMVSHLDHLLEGYKQDLVRVVQVSFFMLGTSVSSLRCLVCLSVLFFVRTILRPGINDISSHI